MFRTWLGMEQLNLIQQQHTFTNQKKCTTTQNKQKKLKPGSVAFCHIWPGNGERLFWFWHFVNLSQVSYFDTRPHMGQVVSSCHDINDAYTTLA